MIEDTKQLFFFPDLGFVTKKTNTFCIKEVFLLPALLPTTILEKKDNDSLSFITLDNDALSQRQSIKIRYILNKNEVVAYH